ncbi:MAG: hypothetical protein LJE95_14205 [Acidobacteria bacterium]|nr:hypothetical protein [Acidobacteriota bacterium]
MKRLLLTLVALAVGAGAFAQGAAPRAWQQRLQVDVPLPVPVVALEAANPFVVALDEPPKLVRATPPRKMEINLQARVAAYVNADGDCDGAVPLDSPFAALAQPLVSGLNRGRFEPARSNKTPEPSWVVLQIGLEGKIKESATSNQSLVMPSPASPPSPPQAAPPYRAGRLAQLPAVDPSRLTTLAVPRRVRVRISGGEIQSGVHALVHLTASGKCDRFVPLEVDSGLLSWLSAYFATWQVTPGRRNGNPVACWVDYSAKVVVKLSSLSSTTVTVLTGVPFTPSAAGSSAPTPGGG